MKRGIVRTNKSKLVAVWIPIPVESALDRAVEREDTDRSKFIRRALRDRLEKLGVIVEAY